MEKSNKSCFACGQPAERLDLQINQWVCVGRYPWCGMSMPRHLANNDGTCCDYHKNYLSQLRYLVSMSARFPVRYDSKMEFILGDSDVVIAEIVHPEAAVIGPYMAMAMNAGMKGDLQPIVPVNQSANILQRAREHVSGLRVDENGVAHLGAEGMASQLYLFAMEILRAFNNKETDEKP